MAKKFTLSKKKLFTIAGVVVLLGAAVLAGILTQQFLGQQEGGEEIETPTLPQQVDEVQNIRSEGNDEEALKKIDEALADQSTAEDTRYQLYIQQGHAFFDQQNWQAAIEAYAKAEAINSTMETAELLAETYAAKGDSAKAIEYFKKAIPLIPEDNPRRDALRESFELRINELEGQQ